MRISLQERQLAESHSSFTEGFDLADWKLAKTLLDDLTREDANAALP